MSILYIYIPSVNRAGCQCSLPLLGDLRFLNIAPNLQQLQEENSGEDRTGPCSGVQGPGRREGAGPSLEGCVDPHPAAPCKATSALEGGMGFHPDCRCSKPWDPTAWTVSAESSQDGRTGSPFSPQAPFSPRSPGEREGSAQNPEGRDTAQAQNTWSAREGLILPPNPSRGWSEVGGRGQVNGGETPALTARVLQKSVLGCGADSRPGQRRVSAHRPRPRLSCVSCLGQGRWLRNDTCDSPEVPSPLSLRQGLVVLLVGLHAS